MKAPVRRIVILRRTRFAHHEFAHRGARPVVGERLDNGETRPAVGAVGEGVSITPVRRIGNVTQAIRAGGEVGHDERRLCAASAFTDFKRGESNWIQRPVFQAQDAGNRGLVLFKSPQEHCQRRRVAFYLQEYPLAGVQNPAGQAQFESQAIHEGPETYPLHSTPHHHTQTGNARQIFLREWLQIRWLWAE
jgi:hypothetical protein